MKTPGAQLFGSVLNRLGPAWLPFADAASPTLPLGKLARLSLFQVSVGMALVLLNGTLNRVMIVELSVPAWLVATMVSVPLLIAPLRALIGHRSDSYVSVLGWRRVPFMGLQYAGLGMMPFALLVLSEASGTSVLALGLAGLAFLLVGSGLHITQTAGLALASDLASEETRPRVVAFLYVMLLLGMVLSALVFGSALAEFSQLRLIQVIQSAAVVTLVLNVVALWKQEVRNPALTAAARPRRPFSEAWAEFMADRTARRLLLALGLGTAGALWRRGPGPQCGGNNRSDGASGWRLASCLRGGLPSSRPRRRSSSPSGLWRRTRRAGLCPGRVLRAPGHARTISPWHHFDWRWRRLFCHWNAHCGHGLGGAQR